MRILLIAILSLTSMCLQAQDKKVCMSTFFTPSFAYRYTTVDYEFAEAIKTYRDTIDHHMFGFQAGQLIHIPINKRLTINTGIAFSDMGHLQRHKYIITSATDDTITNAKLDLFYHRTYLDVPLMLDYKFSISRLSYYLGLGVETNILLNEYELALLDDKPRPIKVFNNSVIKPVNFSAKFNLGCEYLLNSKMSFYTAISLKTQLKPVVTNYVNEYDYLGGITLGLKYQLK